MLNQIRELTDVERIEARERAQETIIKMVGARPQRDQFQNVTISEYPTYVKRLVAGLLAVVMVAAALPSLFRLYSAGYHHHMESLDSAWQATLVGVSTFMLAEFLIICSTLAASIFFKDWRKYLFVIPVVMGLAVALVGNWSVVQPHTLFGWLETLVPPFSVLVVSFIGERLILDSIKQQHEDERQYQEALKLWKDQTGDVEQHPKWMNTYARSLMESIRQVNSSGSGMKARIELMNTMKQKDWSRLVRRELATEQGDWLLEPEPEPEPVGKAMNGNGMNGHHAQDANEFMKMTVPVNVSGGESIEVSKN